MTAAACTLGVLWLLWSSQGKLTTPGLEVFNWNQISRVSIAIAFFAGMTAGSIEAYAFYGYERGASSAFTEV